MSKVADIITEKIIKALEQGIIPWQKPWKSWEGIEVPCGATGRAYRGINQWLLPNDYDSPYFLTFNQVKKEGGSVKKGEKGHMVVFWKQIKINTESDDGIIEEKMIPFLRYYIVFNACQCQDLPEKYFPAERDKRSFDPICEAEKIVSGYENCPPVFHGGNRAFYSSAEERIQLPAKESFNTPQDYYATAFHEMIHSTKHSSRLNRKETGVSFFGGDGYAREELTAEIGSSILCHKAGIGEKAFNNTAAYVQNWLDVLKKDTKAVIIAASKAEKAVDYIQGSILLRIPPAS